MKGCEEFVVEASARITPLSVTEVVMQMNDADTICVDVRCENELWRTGMVAGAVNVPRGMLELVIDPTSPYHNPIFGSDKTFIFCCASGIRSALAAQLAQEMGLAHVTYLAGGLKAWTTAGYALVPYRKQSTFEEVPKEDLL